MVKCEMDARAVQDRFAENRRALNVLLPYVWIVHLIWLVGSMVVLDGVRARAGLAVGVVLWIVWWVYGVTPAIPSMPSLQRPRHVLRSSGACIMVGGVVGLFAMVILGQWTRGTWLLVHRLPLARFMVLTLWYPVTEELLYRRALLSLLYPTYSCSRVRVAVVSASIFAAMHLSNLSTMNTVYVVMQTAVAWGAGFSSALHVLPKRDNPIETDSAPQQENDVDWRWWEVVVVHIVNNIVASSFDPTRIRVDDLLVWVYFIGILLLQMHWAYCQL
jgi:hypothetical protein